MEVRRGSRAAKAPSRATARLVPKTGRPTIEPKILRPTGLDRDLLDPDAVRALQRLQARGFEAYLVGGCVRDLLLGLKPKDFDIATAARPAQVKRTFPRNCRIIGRRFKLAHLHFDHNRKILEVATFRKSPVAEGEGPDDLLITQDNEFGEAMDDALRRDFTVNALFFDPISDRIIDYANGLADLGNRVLCTIGEPIVRFREDPVRIIRAARFASRLGLTLERPTFEAMAEVSPDLSRSAPPRMLEEILRLLRGGHSLESFQILRDIGALKVILPVIAEFLAEAPESSRVRFWRTLEALDQKMLSGEQIANPVMLGVLFAAPVQAQAVTEKRRSWTSVAEALIGPFAGELRLPRRDAGCLKRICGVQPRFTARGPKRFSTGSFLRDPYFEEALRLFELTCMATGEALQDLRRWKQLQRTLQQGEAEEETPEATARPAPATADDDPARPPEESGASRPRRKRSGRTRSGRAKAAVKKAAAQPKADSRRPAARRPAKATHQAKADGKKTARKSRSTRGAKKRTKGTAPRSHRVETIEPETFDVSAFNVELDARSVPTFGVIVEGGDVKKKKRQIPQAPPTQDEDYRPPPPPTQDPDPAPPRPDDEFGDW